MRGTINLTAISILFIALFTSCEFRPTNPNNVLNTIQSPTPESLTTTTSTSSSESTTSSGTSSSTSSSTSVALASGSFSTPSATYAKQSTNIDFSITYSNASAISLVAGDLTVTQTGTASCATPTVTGTGLTTRTVSIGTCTGDGGISISSASGTATNSAGSSATSFGPSDTVTIDNTSPTVSSIVRVGATQTNATSVSFTVTFSETVTGVGSADFALATTGVTGTSITSVTGSGTTYTVAVNTGSQDGTIKLNLSDDDSILDLAQNPLGGSGTGNADFTTGETYTIGKTPTITFIDQPGGIANGGNTIVLTGTNFYSGLTIKVNAVNCTTSTYSSATSASCVVPAHASGSSTIAKVDVTLTNSDLAVATLTNGYTYLGAPLMWLDASKASSFTEVSGKVSQWADLSGNNKHAEQTNSSLRPTRSTAGTGLTNTQSATIPAIYFGNDSGTSTRQYLEAPITVSSTSSFTFFSLLKKVSGLPGNEGTVWLSGGSGWAGTGLYMYNYVPTFNGSGNGYSLDDYGGLVDLDLDGDGTEGGSTCGTAACANYADLTNGYHISATRFVYTDGTNKRVTNWTDTNQKNFTYNVYDRFDSATETLNIGGHFDAHSSYFDLRGHIPELVWYSSALTNAQTSILMDYLNSKYNLSVGR